MLPHRDGKMTLSESDMSIYYESYKNIRKESLTNSALVELECICKLQYRIT